MSSIKLPETKHVLLEIPTPYVLLVTINREKYMNALNMEACWEMDRVWKWMDQCDDIIGILTGRGPTAFSAGMDLKERLTFTSSTPPHLTTFPPTGFGGLTRRVGLKPVIAAVNGHAHGGGFELALNADIVLASPNATFRLPDVLRGTAALQGALPRLVRVLGMQRAGIVALAGEEVGARRAEEWGLVARVVEEGKREGEGNVVGGGEGRRVEGEVARSALVKEAIKLAQKIAQDCSPDSVIATRAGLREAWETGSVERATQLTAERWGESVFGGWNMREGLNAFMERRRPRWRGVGGRSLL